MTTTRLELHDTEANSHKFYEVTVDGSTITRRWGRVGAAGQTAAETAASPDAALATATKLLAGKQGKGYQPVPAAGTPAADQVPAPSRSPRPFVPMLCGTGTPDSLTRPGYLWSPKLDGIRALAHYDGTTVRLTNRRGVDITARYPDVTAALATVLTRPAVLDGEIVVFDPDGKPSFSRVAHRDQASKPAKIAANAKLYPAAFLAFDLLSRDGEELRAESLALRLLLLNTVADWTDSRVQLVPHLEDGPALWAAVVAQQLEGVVGKRATSTYSGRRGEDWLKVKTLHRVTAVVHAYETGEGARADTIGALHLHMVDGAGALVFVGKVGTGFTRPVLDELKGMLDAGQPFLAEIECLSIGSGGQLRFPAYKARRLDLPMAAASVDQLADLPTN